jgi:gas vesicle protein
MMRVVGFLIGFAIGGAIVLYLTPGSGEQNRARLRGRVDEALQAGRQAADKARADARTRLSDMDAR